MSRYPVVEAAKAIIRAELDLYAATHGHRRCVTITDLTSGYDAAWRAMGYPTQTEIPTPEPKTKE